MQSRLQICDQNIKVAHGIVTKLKTMQTVSLDWFVQIDSNFVDNQTKHYCGLDMVTMTTN